MSWIDSWEASRGVAHPDFQFTRPGFGGGNRPGFGRVYHRVCGFDQAFMPVGLLEPGKDFDDCYPVAKSAPAKSAEEASTPWMKTALGEVGVSERRGARRANKRILEYFKASGFWGKDDSGGKNAWCGSFVAWVMKQHGIKPVAKAFRAKQWITFGKKLDQPVYGAIGVKSRKGGGHVAFIVGKSKDGKEYYMLGGNQDDKVQISIYPKKVWTTFVFPSGYDSSKLTLPVFKEKASSAGREA